MKKSKKDRITIIFIKIIKKTSRIPIINIICITICKILLSIILSIYYIGKIFLRKGWPTLLLTLTALLSLSTTSFMLIGETTPNEKIDISMRLELKTESPSQDAIVLENMETETNNKIAYDENLNSGAASDECILDLSETQLNTIRSMLSEELEANNKKNFLPTIINNLFFCLLGMIGPSLLRTWVLAYKRVVKFLEAVFLNE